MKPPIDHTGKRFGQLLVLEWTGRCRQGSRVWRCRCDCGRETEVAAVSLTTGNTRTCGCRKEYLVGQRFGRWSIVSPAEGDRWNCVCDCGEARTVRHSHLKNGESRSCGCYAVECTKVRNAKAPGEAAFNHLYGNYQWSAQSRGYDFRLDRDVFRRLVTARCEYCGREPEQEQSNMGSSTTFTYNGVDRVDNSIGYEVGNVVPACGICNMSKGTRTPEEFLAWARAIAQRHPA